MGERVNVILLLAEVSVTLGQEVRPRLHSLLLFCFYLFDCYLAPVLVSFRPSNVCVCVCVTLVRAVGQDTGDRKEDYLTSINQGTFSCPIPVLQLGVSADTGSNLITVAAVAEAIVSPVYIDVLTLKS